jgi:hypothetical protein
LPRQSTTLRTLFLAIVAALAGISNSTAQNSTKKVYPTIPRTWDDRAMETLELPLAHAPASPKPISAEYYYRQTVRPVYRSYPIYRPDKEPDGYLASLKQKDPEIIFDVAGLNTEEDWIRAGEMVFEAPTEFISTGQLFSQVRKSGWYEKNQVPVTKDGVFPFMRYVVREKGKVEVGILSCAMCHTRVMPEGTVIKGAQGNFPDDRSAAYEVRLDALEAKDKGEVLKELRSYMRRQYAVPWLQRDPNAQSEQMSIDEIASVLEAIVPGVCARQGSSAFYPPRIPDLIGVKDRRYLDSTGITQHRTIEDLMRYVALNQGADLLSQYGSFRPVGDLPEPATQSRYSDEQLYALALFVYSLKPPPNPNKFDALAARGQTVFEREGCAGCHMPPLYTNNKLTPVNGFTVPDEHRKQYDIMPRPVGTDPNLALETRRGTGYYKVPSLKGVWYRGPFEHNGSVASLEDWFDPRRLREDYVPTAFHSNQAKTRAVKGHPFGLDLSREDRQALIAFLRTL